MHYAYSHYDPTKGQHALQNLKTKTRQASRFAQLSARDIEHSLATLDHRLDEQAQGKSDRIGREFPGNDASPRSA